MTNTSVLSLEWSLQYDEISHRIFSYAIKINISLLFLLQDATFGKVYKVKPHVFVSANHVTKKGNQHSIHNSITAWVEVG